MDMLDKRFRITKRNPSAPTMHYGLTLTKENILHCALNRQLLPPGYQDEWEDVTEEARRLFIALALVKKYIEHELQVPLYLENILSPERQMGMFALYSNHTRRRLRQSDDEEWEVLEFMKRELDVQEQTARWYWDNRHGSR